MTHKKYFYWHIDCGHDIDIVNIKYLLEPGRFESLVKSYEKSSEFSKSLFLLKSKLKILQSR